MDMFRAASARRMLAVAAAGLLSLLAEPVVATAEPGPRDVLQRYFSLIDQHRFHQAFLIWEISEGRNAARQSEAQFAAGFADTRHVSVVIGPEGEGDGAAGSIYVTLNVRLTARTGAGRIQRFSGQYILRKSNVEGGHHDWEIYRAKMLPMR